MHEKDLQIAPCQDKNHLEFVMYKSYKAIWSAMCLDDDTCENRDVCIT